MRRTPLPAPSPQVSLKLLPGEVALPPMISKTRAVRCPPKGGKTVGGTHWVPMLRSRTLELALDSSLPQLCWWLDGDRRQAKSAAEAGRVNSVRTRRCSLVAGCTASQLGASLPHHVARGQGKLAAPTSEEPGSARTVLISVPRNRLVSQRLKNQGEETRK